MTESRIEKLTRIGQEMAAAVDEMRAEAVDLTPDLTTKLAIRQIEGEAAWWRSVGHDRSASRTFESMTGDSQQAVRTGVERVLAHLQSVTRLIPAGGMALTAEQVAALKRLMDAQPDEVPQGYDLLEALFPATDPAEEAVGDPLQAWKEFLKPKPIGWYRTMTPQFATEYFGFPDGSVLGQTHTASDGGTWGWCGDDWELLVYPPAPAEPAEEEAKAELCAVRLCVLPARHSGVHADREGLRWNNPTSSPVIPAPTETGPWHAVAEIPKAVACIKDREGDVWRRCGSGWEHGALHDPVDYSPFVAAEEGDA